jgi:hypothetical protein
MNRRIQIACSTLLAFAFYHLASSPIVAQGDWSFVGVRLEKVDGLAGPNAIFAGDTIRFHMMYGNSLDCSVALSNAIKVYSRASLTSGEVGSGTATWVTVPPTPRPFNVKLTNPVQSTGTQVDTTGFIHKSDFGALFLFKCFGCDGSGADTIVFSAARNEPEQRGFQGPDSGVIFIIWIVTNPADTGKVICIDSATNYPPSGTWSWPSFECYWEKPIDWFPSWSGGRCFTLVPYDCCHGATGNVDCDAGDHVDISDISTLIDHLYLTNNPLCCPEQADCDGLGGVDIADLSALISHLYISFMPLAACQ